MSRILISGGHIVSPVDERITDLCIEDGLISAIGPASDWTGGQGALEIDARGCWVTPGLFDIQVNGGPPCDFWGDPTVGQVSELSHYLAQHGVTTILPTLITDDLKHLRKNIDFLTQKVGIGIGTQPLNGAAKRSSRMPVRMPGIHLEGPCLSPEKPGVHPVQHLAPLSLDLLKRIITPAVKLITLAPELDPGGETLEYLKKHNVHIALGHSNATFEQAAAGFNAGIQLMTHTFNALPPIHHRAPGAVTAALLDDRVSCCMICDGLHLSPPAAALIARTKGVKNTILVTDIAHVGTTQGGLVGSSITLDDAVRNVVGWGVMSFQDAIQAASYNPAKALGFDESIGHLKAGKAADVVLWDKHNLQVKAVVCAGQVLN